jgi:hypothetical protein
VEDILAITFLFGGGTMVLLSFSPVGKAIAERIRHGKQQLPAPEVDGAVYEELDHIRAELGEIHERLDFTERLLANEKAARPSAEAEA